MTKILFITNKDDLTTDFVVREVQNKKVNFYRLNTEEIGVSVFLTLFFDGKCSLYDEKLKVEHDLKSFTAVYFRRPVFRDINDRSLTEAEKQFIKIEHYQTLEGLYKLLSDAFWISYVDSIRCAENKIYQQILALKVGMSIVPGMITNRPEDFIAFLNGHKNDCIIKSIRSGQVGIVNSEKIAYTSILSELPPNEQIVVCPSYIQKHIKKQFDIRVTVVGRKLFATAILSQGCHETVTDWRKGEHILPYKEIELPKDVENKCLKLVELLGLRFGAIDFILDMEGNYVFLEINPNGQWAWIECRTNYRISEEIANLLINEGN